jgi:hypothetical protein
MISNVPCQDRRADETLDVLVERLMRLYPGWIEDLLKSPPDALQAKLVAARMLSRKPVGSVTGLSTGH